MLIIITYRAYLYLFLFSIFFLLVFIIKKKALSPCHIWFVYKDLLLFDLYYYLYFLVSFSLILCDFFSSLVLFFSLRPTRPVTEMLMTRKLQLVALPPALGEKNFTSWLGTTTTDCKYFSFSHLSSPILFIHRSGQPLSYTTKTSFWGGKSSVLAEEKNDKERKSHPPTIFTHPGGQNVLRLPPSPLRV